MHAAMETMDATLRRIQQAHATGAVANADLPDVAYQETMAIVFAQPDAAVSKDFPRIYSLVADLEGLPTGAMPSLADATERAAILDAVHKVQ